MKALGLRIMQITVAFSYSKKYNLIIAVSPTDICEDVLVGEITFLNQLISDKIHIFQQVL